MEVFLLILLKNTVVQEIFVIIIAFQPGQEENQIIYIRRKGKLVQASVGAGRNSNNVVAKIKPDFKKKKKSREIRGLIFLEEQGIFFLLKRLMKISYLSNVNLLFLSLTQYSSKETAYLLKNVCTHIFVSLTVSFNY